MEQHRLGRVAIASSTDLKHSLKTRVTIITLVISMISIWSLAILVAQKLHKDIERALGEQQLSTASAVAAQVNAALEDRLKGLQTFARERITPEMMADAAATQALLQDSPILSGMFNAGVFVTDAEGTAIAAIPVTSSRVGLNYKDQDAIADALRLARPGVGRPVIGKAAHTPIIRLVAPVLDARGSVLGAVVGVTDLGKPNFLDTATSVRYARTGSYLLVSKKYRVIVTASDKRRVMEDLPPEGVNPKLDRFIEGWEGVEVLPSPIGMEVLAAVKGVPAADWYAVVALPTREAFEPVYELRDTMMLTALLITLVSGGLTWWMLKRELQPLQESAEALAAMTGAKRPLAALHIARQDEIGQLVGSFNQLLAKLEERQQALAESEQRWKFALEGSGDGVWDWNIQTGEAHFTKRWKEQLGFAENEIADRASEWSDRVHAEDMARVMAAIQAHVDGRAPSAEVEFRMLCKDGRWIWILGRGIVVSRSDDGKPLRLVGTNTDITLRKQMEEQIRQQALHDALTGLPNRRMLGDRIDHAMASSKRTGHHGALLVVDLDTFKALNDLHGHAAGDLLLVEVGRRLRSCVREVDTVARIGGDEFVVLLGDLSPSKADSAAQAASVAEEIRASLSAPYLLTLRKQGQADSTVEHRCTASIGMALFVGHEATRDEVLKSADGAMYEAKSAGGNAVRIHGAREGTA